jgi:hypothetical protein
MVILGAIIAVAVLVFFLKAKSGTVQFAKRIKIDGLKDELINLQNGKTDYPFIGIISRGVDCIYFYYDNKVFNIEYEAPDKEYLPYFEMIEAFSKANNIHIAKRTYERTENSQKHTVSVIRLEVNTDLNGAVALGKRLEKEIFKNTTDTEYEVVP